MLERTARFPRHLRLTLSQRIENLTLQILEDLTSASWRRDKDKALRSASDALNRLRILLRLSHAMHLLSDAQFAHAAEEIAVAGRMLGGWLRQRSPRGEEPWDDKPPL